MSEQISRFSMDYLTITVHAPASVAVAAMNEWNIFEQMQPAHHGARSYAAMSKHPSGFKIYYSPIDEKQEHFCLEFPSGALHALPYESILRWVKHVLYNYRCNVTRLDLAMDTQLIHAREVWGWLEQDLYSSRVRKDNIKEHGGLDVNDYTVYIGSRESECMLRLYRKQILGDDVFGDEFFTRFELELHDTRSTRAMYDLMFLPMVKNESEPEKRDWSTYYYELMNGFITFHVDKWTEFVTTSKKTWVKILKRKSNVRRTGSWLSKQVYRSLAMYLEYTGNLNATNMYGDFSSERKEEAIEMMLQNIYERGKRDMSDWQKKIAESGLEPLVHKSISVTSDDILYDGRNYNVVLEDFLSFVGSPLVDKVAAMSEWEKKQVYYISQMELPGIDMAALLKNPAISHYSQ